MTDSVRMRILENVRDTLKTIDGPPGYYCDLSRGGGIYFYARSMAAIEDAPAIVIVVLEETKSQERVFGFQEGTLRIGLVCVTREGDRSDAVRAIDALFHDVERVLMRDPQRGGLAYDTRVVRMVGYPEEDQLPMISFLVEIEVVYRHGVSDPKSLTGG